MFVNYLSGVNVAATAKLFQGIVPQAWERYEAGLRAGTEHRIIHQERSKRRTLKHVEVRANQSPSWCQVRIILVHESVLK